jgi:hypothetical protein
MLYLHHPEQTSDPTIRALLELRLKQLRSLKDFILIEPGDPPNLLDDRLALELGYDLMDDHGTCYEMVFITDDDEASTVLIIPKHPSIHPDWLTYCQSFYQEGDFLCKTPL